MKINILKKLFTSITIMMIPHSSSRSFRVRVPAVSLLSVAVLAVFGAFYVYTSTLDALKYRDTKTQLEYYTGQFNELESTISALRDAEREFSTLFLKESKEEVLENFKSTDAGAIDMEILKLQIKKTVDSVGSIKDYLSEQRDLYMATPQGWPVDGWLSSRYGRRKHPIRGGYDFHSGVDISARPGAAVKTTADGIVSFSGWSGANGRLVSIEHGFGFSTFYGHNKKNTVNVGDVVKRGDIIAYVGSTGSSTGPHVHYEVSMNDKSVNPKPYLKEGNE